MANGNKEEWKKEGFTFQLDKVPNAFLPVSLRPLPLCIRDREEQAMRYSERLCTRYQQAIELLGKRWTGLILFLLLDGPLRFHEMATRLEVVSDRMLSERLKELESEGVVERCVYPDTPVRVEYRLTTKGQALAPVIDAIGQWSHDWIPLETDTVSEATA